MPKPLEPHPYRLTVTRYYGADGRRVSGPGAGVEVRREESRAYYADLPGRKRVPLKTSSLGQAWVELRRLLQEQERRRLGIVDQYTEAADKPLAEHVTDWITVVRSGGVTSERLDVLQARVNKLAHLVGWQRITDITADSCLSALSLLITSENRSAQTRNHYLSHVKQFVSWLHDGGKLLQNPLRRLKPISVETDRRHDRREPSSAEMQQLFDWLYTGTPEPALNAGKGGRIKGGQCVVRLRNGMTGPHRALGYKVAMAAGLRASEMRSLSRESFDLNAGTVTVRASYSKRRRRDILHLPPWLIGELRLWFAENGGCWQSLPRNHPGDALRRDLEDAGVAYRIEGPDGPLFFDYHALRHWYCTQVANQPGISPKTMMVLCRHSTPSLTLKLYAKVRQQDVKEAVNNIPVPGLVAPKVAPKAEQPRTTANLDKQ